MDRPAPTTLTRHALIEALRSCAHPLAGSAILGLEHTEAPEILDIWLQPTPDLLAIYEERLLRVRSGDGPATSGLEEYLETLRNQDTSAMIGEVAWGAGDTFFVALLSNSTVLGVTTVARAVSYLEERVTHLDQGTNQWVSDKAFIIGEGFNDQTLIKNTLNHRAYADNYQGTEVEEQDGTVHGPFLLARIKAEDFAEVPAHAAIAEIQDWADQTGRQSAPTQSALATEIFALLSQADVVYRFPSLGEDTEGPWGWVVGRAGFHEFITIDRDSACLHLIVASDD